MMQDTKIDLITSLAPQMGKAVCQLYNETFAFVKSLG